MFNIVEFQLAKRLNGRITRQTTTEYAYPEFQLFPFTYPNIAALIPTFDCEGQFGGGSSDKGETKVIPRILNQFKRLNCQGTFNFVGKTAEKYEDIVKQIDNLECDVWGHGYSHSYLDSVNSPQEKEVSETIKVLSRIIAKPCVGWRSPYGTFDLTLYQILLNNGIKYGSNWGTSTWGYQPFTPIINNKKLDIAELPFDDCHFDALLFRKLSLTPEVVLNLFRSKLLAHIDSTSIFTPLIHPVNLAEDERREKMFVDFIDFAAKQKNLWITSCSQILSIYNILQAFEIQKLEFLKENDVKTIFIKIKRKNIKEESNSLATPNKVITFAFISAPIEEVDCNLDYKVIHLSEYKDVLCIPFNLLQDSFTVDLQLKT